ncbi:hypothetical protein GGR57DRAFT_394623 [Xylariaceae sp. FL1272]|nr:hypothetical protein GGR57DRAFT_394623 [Xylariaceae sp. FL1272]
MSEKDQHITTTEAPPPDYEDVVTSSHPLPPYPSSSSPQSLTYCKIPPQMRIYYTWRPSGFKTFFVCGSGGESDRLFTVKVHTGYSFSPPLGMKHGLHLYNSAESSPTENCLLAAMGDSSLFGSVVLDNDSLVYIPPLPAAHGGAASTGASFANEVMRARTTPNGGVGWCFAIEVNDREKIRRERFEWRRVNKEKAKEPKSDDGEEHFENGGFKLFRLAGTSADHQNDTAGEGSSSRLASNNEEVGELLARFTYRSLLKSPKHPFDLELVGEGVKGGLGERWSLMVLVTALRLWYMHVNGKTKRSSVAATEKIMGKGKEVI